MPSTSATYKTRVAEHLESAASRYGLTQQQLAERLGLKKGNYVSMLANPATKDQLSLSRLPALAKLCGLTPAECLALVYRRIADHPDQPVQLDVDVFKLVLTCTVAVVDAKRAAGAAIGAGAPGGH
jgi:transcriptional regulator with XRE-family HTH domain